MIVVVGSDAKAHDVRQHVPLQQLSNKVQQHIPDGTCSLELACSSYSKFA